MAAKGWGVTPRTSAAFHFWVALFAHVTVINRSNHTFPAPLPSVGLWKVKYFIWQYTVNIWIIWIYDGIYDCCFFRRMIKCLLSTGWVAKWILETKHFAWMNNPSYMRKKSIFFQLLYKKNKQTKEKKEKEKKGDLWQPLLLCLHQWLHLFTAENRVKFVWKNCEKKSK